MENEKKNYTVWVGGVEVNDEMLTKEEAEKLAQKYIADGYDDVQVENVEDGGDDGDAEIIRRLESFISYCLSQDKGDATFNELYGFYVSHFNKVCYRGEIATKLAQELVEASKETKNDFLDEFDIYVYDNAVRVCDACGKFITEGYYLAGEYACSDECAIKLYNLPEEEARKQLEEDLSWAEEADGECYWTEW